MRSPRSVEMTARKPSHLTSKDHPGPEGSGPGRDIIGAGSRRSEDASGLDFCLGSMKGAAINSAAQRRCVGALGLSLGVAVSVAALAVTPTSFGYQNELAADAQSRVVRGTGKRVVSVNIARRDPIVVTGVHTGSRNFIVSMVKGSAKAYVFNEIGRYNGQALVHEGAPGRWRVVVDADGAWTLKFAQGLAPARTLPTLLTGTGSRVVAVRVARDLQPVVTGSHRGQRNFLVGVTGYGTDDGYRDFVFNEIGRFRGETLIDDLPAGRYYVDVNADGAWTVRFSR
jgi:hypothetical protein